MASLAWLLAAPMLKARGWNPSYTFEQNVFFARSFALFMGLCGLGFVLEEPAGTLLPSHLFVPSLAGLFAVFLGAGTLAWSVAVLRLRRAPGRWFPAVSIVLWVPVMTLLLMASPPRTHDAAGAVLVGVLMSIGSWSALLLLRPARLTSASS